MKMSKKVISLPLAKRDLEQNNAHSLKTLLLNSSAVNSHTNEYVSSIYNCQKSQYWLGCQYDCSNKNSILENKIHTTS